jgi:phage gpG-like protein
MKTFGNIPSFVAFLAHAVEESHKAEEVALDRAAKVIETEAKAIVGHYQKETGPYAAWPELADATKEERVRRGYTENDPLLRTGALRSSIERVVAGHTAHVGSNLDEAVFQELGTSRIPPRSFLGAAAFRKGEEAALAAGETIVAALTGEHPHPITSHIPHTEGETR